MLEPSYVPSVMGALAQELDDGDDKYKLIEYADDVIHIADLYINAEYNIQLIITHTRTVLD